MDISRLSVPERINPLFENADFLLTDSHGAFVIRVFDEILTEAGGDGDKIKKEIMEDFFWLTFAYRYEEEVNREVYKTLSSELEEYLENIQNDTVIHA